LPGLKWHAKIIKTLRFAKFLLFLHANHFNMKIRNKLFLDKFVSKHADSVKAVQKFIDIVEEAQWKNLNDIKADINSVDYVSNGRYIFNIKGNKYRIIAIIIFIDEIFIVRFIGTHAEYSKIDAKNI